MLSFLVPRVFLHFFYAGVYRSVGWGGDGFSCSGFLARGRKGVAGWVVCGFVDF